MCQKKIFVMIVMIATAMLMSASAFAQTVIPERDWEYIRIDDEHVSIGNADKSRRVSAIDQGTAGDIEIQSSLRSSKVVNIDDQAFQWCAKITSVVIPDGVTNIAGRAFYGCTSLTNVVIPASVKSIGELAFYNCNKLQRIRFVDGARILIGKAAFMNCSSAMSIEIATTDVIELQTAAFSGCTGAKECELQSKKVSIAEQAFSYYSYRIYDVTHKGLACGSISNVAISAVSTASIGNAAFSNCVGLVTAELPDVLETLSPHVFYHCSSLRSFVFPTNLTRIAYRAFDTCSALERVKFNDRLETIEDQAFYGCRSLQEVEFPQSVVSVGARAFEECRSVARIEFEEGDANLHLAASVEIGDRAFFRCLAATNIVLSQNVKSFGSRAFAQCDALELVGLPTNLTEISESAFEDCFSLTMLELPSSLKSIGLAAFRGCSSYREFLIPTNSVVDIGAKAFLNTRYWNDWPDDSIVENNGYILGFKGDPVSVELPKGCKIIPAGMFENMTNLMNVTIPTGVVSVGSRAFANSGIVAIELNDAETIGVSAFEGCSGLAGVSLSDDLTAIPDNAFKDCTSLREIDIPDSVNSIGAYAFFACSSLQTATGGESVGFIGDYAFANCTALEPKRFASDVVYGVHVFQGCVWDEYVLFPSVGTLREEYPESYSKIRSVVFSSGQTDIVADACRGCISLEYIDIPGSVVSVGSNAFYGCSSVTSVVMTSGLANVASNAFSGCSNIVSATVSGAVPVMTLFPDVYATIKDLSIAQGCDALCGDLFHGCAAIEQIEIPWTVTSIGDRAFYGCTSLGASGVLIPEKVTAIGENAFAFCSSLESVRFLCPKPNEVAENIYYKSNPELVTAVLQPYKESWLPVMTNSWPVANSAVMGRRIMWWNTDCLARITFAYYNGTGLAEYQYYLKNAGRTIEELPEPPVDMEYDSKEYGDFIGWFTEPYGGEQVEEGFDVTTSTVLYAHWSGNEIDDSDDEGDYDFSSAHTYNGYVLDNEALVGSVQIKIGKGRYSKADGETNAVANATFQLLGEGKVAAKGVLHEDASGELVHRKSERELTISIDGGKVSGSFDGLDVVAGRDFFSSSARPDTIMAKTVLDELGGLYNVVLSVIPDGDYAFYGYVGISLQIGQRGSVKISGALPDGTKLTASCPLVCLDDQIYVPAVIPAYSGKKGGIAFMLNFSEGDMILDNVSDWIGAKGEAIGVLEAEDVSDVAGLQNGEYQFVADISDFEIEGETIDDSFSPDGTVISVLSGRWRVPRADTVKFVGDEGYAIAKDNGNPSGLKLSYTVKTGLFKGSFKLYGVTDGGKSKKHTVTVSGAVVNGVGYGCAYIKKVGGVPVAVDGGVE